MKIPKIITHKNAGPLREILCQEQEFKIGAPAYKPTGKEWYREMVTLEFPLGELAKDGLMTLALVGRHSA